MRSQPHDAGRNPDLDLGEAQKCGRVNFDNWPYNGNTTVVCFVS